jgi:CRP/FNR family transcriptional regulator, anaerobic regulatory protein
MVAMLNNFTAERSPMHDLQTTQRAPAHGESFKSSIDTAERSTLRCFLSKEHIFCEGDPRTQVYQIKEGVVTVYQILNDGRRQIVDFAYPGDYLGLGTTSEHVFSAETTTPVKVACLGAKALDTAARGDPSLALQLYRAVSLELSAARKLLVAIGQRSAIERIATFLLMLHDRRMTEDGGIDLLHLPMRRADIGDFLGLTIETVSRSFTKLKVLGIIEVVHNSEIRIADLHRLIELSERQTYH